MLRVGLIGNGGIAGAHRKSYARLTDRVSLEACCDIRPERFEMLDQEKVRCYTDIDEMLAKEKGKLDYVDICLPTYLHAEAAIKAMEAGFHVLSEKPMARTVEEARCMTETAERTGKTLMIAYCNRFYDAARAMKEIVDSKELGKVRSADFYRENGTTDSMGWNDWFHDGALSGGAMLDLHVHDVDMIRWIFGMPKAVSAVAGSYITKGGYDNMSVNYMYGDGVFVHASCSWILHENKYNTRSFRVNCEKGYIYIDRSPGRETFVKVLNDGTVTDLSEKLPFDSWHNEIVYFTDRLSKGLPVTECMPVDCEDSIKIIMAEMKSADKEGMKVDIV